MFGLGGILLVVVVGILVVGVVVHTGDILVEGSPVEDTHWEENKGIV